MSQIFHLPSSFALLKIHTSAFCVDKNSNFSKLQSTINLGTIQNTLEQESKKYAMEAKKNVTEMKLCKSDSMEDK